MRKTSKTVDFGFEVFLCDFVILFHAFILLAVKEDMRYSNTNLFFLLIVFSDIFIGAIKSFFGYMVVFRAFLPVRRYDQTMKKNPAETLFSITDRQMQVLFQTSLTGRKRP